MLFFAFIVLKNPNHPQFSLIALIKKAIIVIFNSLSPNQNIVGQGLDHI